MPALSRFALELVPDVGGTRVEAEHVALHAIADGLNANIPIMQS